MSTVCRSYPFHSSIPPFITPFHLPLCPLCHSLCPLCALAFVWVRPESGGPRQKNSACHGERAKVFALRGVGVEGWLGVRVGKALSKPWLSIVVSDLTPTSPISSVSDFLVCPPFPWASVFFGSEGWEYGKREMRQMSGMKLFACLVLWLLQAWWRSAQCAPPPVALVVNTPGEVLLPPVMVQTLEYVSLSLSDVTLRHFVKGNLS